METQINGNNDHPITKAVFIVNIIFFVPRIQLQVDLSIAQRYAYGRIVLKVGFNRMIPLPAQSGKLSCAQRGWDRTTVNASQ